ncbi:MAG: basic secretory protein-like protein [Akkermansiaceae bacterium]|jgi:hypothetical protein
MYRVILSILVPTFPLLAEISLTTERLEFGSGFAFETIPAPAINDLGGKARWSVIGGQADRNGGALKCLYDGKVPSGDDQPRENFFFSAGSNGGLIHVDFGETVELERITTFSRHFKNRGPQVYTLYGTKSDQKPDARAELTGKGWKKIAEVDTRRPGQPMGGRHGANLTGDFGQIRQLVFEIKPTERKTPFGLTFLSEIDLVQRDGPKLKWVPTGPKPKVIRFATRSGDFTFIVDATEAPQYAGWVEKELKPTVLEWYPKVVSLLPSKDYQAPSRVLMTFRNDVRPGIPAYANGSRVVLNAPWFKNQLKREAKGCVIHELVHVVQNYWSATKHNPNPSRTPTWVTEGIADYIRWFLFEPESKGAHYPPERIKKMKHDASYRISANFLDWVSRNHNKDIVPLINDAARHGRYDDSLWKKHTGKSVEELAEGWKSQS